MVYLSYNTIYRLQINGANMSYERLNEISHDLIEEAGNHAFIRTSLFNALTPPKQNVVILKGARGIGKSTLLQQFLYQQKKNQNKVLYLSADSTLLETSLAKFAHEYQKRGGMYLAIDEIHKYNDWQSEIKTILDSFTNLHVLVSGSSSISLQYSSADLSRRHIMLCAKGLSFREFAKKNYEIKMEAIQLQSILSHAEALSHHIATSFRKEKVDLLEAFKLYLKEGFFLSRENYHTPSLYYDSLLNTMNSVIDADLPYIYHDIDNISKQKIKSLLRHIATKCPFTPNISELSKNLSIANNNTLKKYLYYLNSGEILTNLYCANKSHKDFQRPQKIFLNNTNFAYAHDSHPLIGTIRETFAANCLRDQGDLTAPTFGDFCLNGEWVFEIGGKSKNKKQIKSIKQSVVLADDILSVENGNVPLWLLGFLW